MKWDSLVKKALEAKEFAYAPYSGFRVGAAVLTSKGSIFTGCNVENVSYGATICAEQTAIVKAVSAGEKEISAIAIACDEEELIFPCGICRQVLNEFKKPETVVVCSNKYGEYREYRIDELLPYAFSKEALK